MSAGFLTAIASIIIFCLLIIYIIGGSFMEHKHVAFGHETGIAIVLGFLVSLIAYEAGSTELVSTFQFNGSIFFYLCLPPIIFTSGFNMRRKRFFENIGYIILFGLVGTIFTFIVFTLLTWGFMQSGIMYKY
jgi:solute carrier family 9 (sodium/hydrogen exchanger), member 6/7